MNAARAAVSLQDGGKEQPLTWDPIAAEVAQAWADQCDWMHNPNASTEYAAKGGSGGLGEDIAAGAPSQDIAGAVKGWVDEKANFTPPNTCASGQVCGHYTQIVWSTTTAVGCAQAQCTTGSPWGPDSGAFTHWTMSVCDFNPPGNWVGEAPY
jgi:hypothetical protein